MRLSALFFFVLSAFQAVASMISYRWGYVPNDESFASNKPIDRVASAKALCALSTGVRDRHYWLSGSYANTSISTNYDAFFSVVEAGSSNIPLAKASLRSATYSDFVSIFDTRTPHFAATNVTMLGYTLGRLDDYNLDTITNAAIANPLVSCSGGSAMPEIVAGLYDDAIAREINYSRMKIGYPSLPTTHTPLDLTEKYFTEAHKKSLALMRTNSWAIINDRWEVPVAQITADIGNLVYSYRGHAKVATESRKYEYERTVFFEREFDTNNEEYVTLRLVNPHTSANDRLTKWTNTFTKSMTISLSASLVTPQVDPPVAKAYYSYVDGSPGGGLPYGAYTYSPGSLSLVNVECMNPELTLNYEATRSRFLGHDGYPTMTFDDHPSFAIRDAEVSSINDILFCSMVTNGVKFFRQSFETPFVMADLEYQLGYGEYTIYQNAICPFTDDYWDNYERQPTAQLSHNELSFERSMGSGSYTVYNGNVLVGWSSYYGGRITQDRPVGKVDEVEFGYEVNRNGLPESGFSKQATVEMTHMGTVKLNSENLMAQ